VVGSLSKALLLLLSSAIRTIVSFHNGLLADLGIPSGEDEMHLKMEEKQSGLRQEADRRVDKCKSCSEQM